MSFTDPAPQRTAVTPPPTAIETEVRGRTNDSFSPPVGRVRETKVSFLTTEFWAMLAGIAALIVLYNVADDPSLNLWRTCLLCSLIGAAYIVSRGFAKSGSRTERWSRDTYGGTR